MPIISIIVAIDEQNAIGRNNQLLCHLPNDLKYFKNITQGHTIIMGRKTFESLPNGALPNRRNIILTHNKDLHYDNAETADSIETAIKSCEKEKNIFIIGGGTLYEKALPLADILYITHIHHKFEGADTFFPKIDCNIWKQSSRIDNPADEKNKYPHSFVVYIRK